MLQWRHGHRRYQCDLNGNNRRGKELSSKYSGTEARGEPASEDVGVLKQ
jgi:hypothetical protein